MRQPEKFGLQYSMIIEMIELHVIIKLKIIACTICSYSSGLLNVQAYFIHADFYSSGLLNVQAVMNVHALYVVTVQAC